MTDPGVQTYASLIAAAERLTAERAIPLSVSLLCDELGVRVERAAVGRARALLVDAKKAPKIVLQTGPHTNQDYSPWERFLIAHELGHLVLHHLSVPKPQETADYWKIEGFCDAFARTLLIPDARFARLAKAASDTPLQRLNLVRYLEQTALVTWAAAAMRVSDWHADSVFFQLKSDSDGGLRVHFSSTRKEMGRMIEAQSPLATALRDGIARNGVHSLKIELLDALPSLRGRLCGAAVANSSDHRLVAILKRDA